MDKLSGSEESATLYPIRFFRATIFFAAGGSYLHEQISIFVTSCPILSDVEASALLC